MGLPRGGPKQPLCHVNADIDQKRRSTAYLHAAPLLLLLADVPELEPFKIQ